MASSIKEMHCSDCLFHHYQASRRLDKLFKSAPRTSSPIRWCTLDNVSQYRKERLAYGDDLIMCDSGRTEIEHKIDDQPIGRILSHDSNGNATVQFMDNGRFDYEEDRILKKAW